MTRPRIRSASIYDPFIIILREDDTMGLFIGERSKSKLRRKDMSMLGDRASLAYWRALEPDLILSLSDRAMPRPRFIPITQDSFDQPNRRIIHPRPPPNGTEVPPRNVRPKLKMKNPWHRSGWCLPDLLVPSR